MMSRKKDVSNCCHHKKQKLYLLFCFLAGDTAIHHKRYLSKTTSVELTQIKRMKFLELANSSHTHPF